MSAMLLLVTKQVEHVDDALDVLKHDGVAFRFRCFEA